MSIYEPLTLAQFLTHAEKFGTEMVFETAESYLSGFELLQLDKELTRIDTERRKVFQKVPRRKRMPKERQLRLVDFLSKEGVPNTRIATHLGLSLRRVEEIRQEGRRAGEKATQTEGTVENDEGDGNDSERGL